LLLPFFLVILAPLDQDDIVLDHALGEVRTEWVEGVLDRGDLAGIDATKSAGHPASGARDLVVPVTLQALVALLQENSTACS
jgi:hypothetical protein